jgi:hypothetical protein
VVQRAAAVYAFIYEVRAAGALALMPVALRRFCTVLALGSSPRQAEAIAINSVHQEGWHILRADTVTALPLADVAELDDGAALIADLERFGVAVRSFAAPAAA